MNTIIIDHDNEVLTSGDFKSINTLYIIKGDYKIDSMIILPGGSELKIDGGSLTYAIKPLSMGQPYVLVTHPPLTGRNIAASRAQV